MAVYLDDGRWRYRRLVRLPDGSKKRISGTSEENTSAAASLAEIRHINRLAESPELVHGTAYPEDLAKASNAYTYLLPQVDRKTLSTNQKGAASEARVLSQLILAGYAVSVAEGSQRYDLVIELPTGELKKVQVKTGYVQDEWLRFNPHSVVPMSATSPALSRGYTVDEVDFFAVYSPAHDATFLIPNNGNVPGGLHLIKTTEEAAKSRIHRKKKNSAVAQKTERIFPKDLDGGANPSGATERSESLEDAPESAQSSCVTSSSPVV